MSWNSLDFFPYLKNVQTILSSHAVQKQVVDWICWYLIWTQVTTQHRTLVTKEERGVREKPERFRFHLSKLPAVVYQHAEFSPGLETELRELLNSSHPTWFSYPGGRYFFCRMCPQSCFLNTSFICSLETCASCFLHKFVIYCSSVFSL